MEELKMSEEAVSVTLDVTSTANSQDSPTILARAERAKHDGRFDSALQLYLEAATSTELPPAELCLKIADCHDRLGANEQAFSWLTKVVDASDAFLDWHAAATALRRLTESGRPAGRRSCRVTVTGSSTTSQLAAMLPLAALRFGIDLVVHEGLYGQYQQDLIDVQSPLYASDPELILIAVDEQALQLPRHSEAPEADVRAEVERWTRLWETASSRTGAHIVQHNFAVRPEAPLGHLSIGISGSHYAMVQALNRELSAAAGEHVSIVDCDRLAANYGRARWFDDRYWFRAKQAVALDALPLLARHTAAVIAGRLGLARKCLVLDLDNTLWGGVVGEDGLEGIALGGDSAGEAFAAFQEYILELKERGVVLAVASKNNEADAREVFERHPEMRIRLGDISVFAVNWEDKPANLRRIAHELDLGLDALALADDNPAERQIVRQLVPQVDVISLPTEPTEYRRVLSDYLGFESVVITSEDRKRADQYRARSAGVELRSSVADIESFYRELQMRAVIAPFDESHLPRIAQLVGKTNQFNLTTRRHSTAELRKFMQSSSHLTSYVKLSDRFGDHGLIALLIAAVDDGILDIDTLLMSCRVIGRTVETQMLAHLCSEAKRVGCYALRGTYIPTAKNFVVCDLYERHGFQELAADDDGTTQWTFDLRCQSPITNEFIMELNG
jgi:FkbH-like protein